MCVEENDPIDILLKRKIVVNFIDLINLSDNQKNNTKHYIQNDNDSFIFLTPVCHNKIDILKKYIYNYTSQGLLSPNEWLSITEEDFDMFSMSSERNNIKKKDCIDFYNNLNQQHEQIDNDNISFDPDISKIIKMILKDVINFHKSSNI